MKGKNRFAFTAIPILSDVALLSTLFLLFSELQTGVQMDIGALPWAALALLSAGAFRWFLKRPRSYEAAVGFGAGLFLAQFLALVLLFSKVSGFFPHALMGACILYTTYKGYALCIKAPTPEQRLTYAELSTLGFLAFLLVQLGPFTPPAFTNVFLFASVALNFVALMLGRASGGAGGSVSLSKWQGGLILLLLGGLTAGAIWFVMAVVLAPAKTAAVAALKGLYTGAVALGDTMKGFIDWLISFMGKPEMGYADLGALPGAGTADLPAEQVQSAFPWGTVVIGLVVAVAVIVLIVLLIKFGKNRTRGLIALYGGPAAQRISGNLLQKLREGFFRLCARVRFFCRFLSRYQTPEGVYLSVLRAGKSRGIPKQEGESPREYLKRLGVLPAELQALADELERRFYGGGSDMGSYPAAAAVRRGLKKLPKRKARKARADVVE